MSKSRTDRELERLAIDTNEDQLPVAPGGRQLRSRVVQPPLPPPRSSSVPVTPSIRTGIHREPTPMPREFIEKNVDSSYLDTTDVESIDGRLKYASAQLRQRFRIQSDDGETSSQNPSPEELKTPVPMQSSVQNVRRKSPSSEGLYMTPQMSDPKSQPKLQTQKPPKILGEVYFDDTNQMY